MDLFQQEEQIYLRRLFTRGIKVLDFEINEFHKFASTYLGYDLYMKYRGFPAFMFEDLLQNEKPKDLIELIKALLDYATTTNEFFDVEYGGLVSECVKIIDKYSTKNLIISNFKADFNSIYIENMQTTMLEQIDENPTEAIGKAKEYIESCCKSILENENIHVDKNWTINKLVDETLKMLELIPKQVDLQEKGAENIKALLGNLKSIPNYLAELRNPYGSGHGKSNNFKSLEPRHAKLAVGASLTFVGFVWDTYQENKK